MKLLSGPVLVRCALLSSIALSSASQPRPRPRASEEHIGAEAYGDAETELDPEIYVANHEVDATDDDYVGDGGEYALGYPSGGEDEVPFEIEPDYDASDADEFEDGRHGSSHSGHYFQDQHDDEYRKEDALVGSGGSYDASGSDDDYDYGRHDGYDRYGYETGVFSGNSITSDLSAGSPESTAPMATNQSAIAAPTLPSANVVLPATRVTLQTIPTSETHLCPDFDGQCLNGNIVRCDRVLGTDTNATSSRYECEFGPGLGVTSERACHESCRRQGDCSGWQMIQTQTFDGSGGDGTTYDCCFVHGHPHLQDPLPQQSRFSTFPAYYSYGLGSYCTDQSPGLCPGADKGCVDDFLVRCGRDLEQDVAAVPGAYTAYVVVDILEHLACHQACAENPRCTAWYGNSKSVDVGGALWFSCWHVFEPIALQPVLAAVSPSLSYNYYGIRGACE